MSNYHIKVQLEDNPNIYRTIVIPHDASFEQLHEAILASFDFKDEQLASFYILNHENQELLEITLEDMNADDTGLIPIMCEMELHESISKVGSRFRYINDFMLYWKFYGEVINIDEKNTADEIYIIESVGESPEQYQNISEKLGTDSEDEKLISQLQMKNFDAFHEDDLLDTEDGDNLFDEEEDFLGAYGEEDEDW